MNIMLFIRTYTLHNRRLDQSYFSHDDITLLPRRVFNPKFCIEIQEKERKIEKERGKRETMREERDEREGMHLCDRR